ncbi:hypothetical protein C5167_021701 [Papaver somniferum]|uniref:SAM domain-containing protein n=2 Tax=Papaver somniferum TaxID=3469 RepID=A0A4Y7JIV9_PAPSO|nr:hypothetical protein C5167_021701 [Papaver somniferum]
MEDEEGGAAVVRDGYRNWVPRQSFLLNFCSSTFGVIRGAAYGASVGVLTEVAKPAAIHSIHLPLSASPMAQARLFAAMGGARASITCIMKRIRGKEDVQARMAAGFGAGVTYKLMLTRMRGPDAAVNAAILGVAGAIVGGCAFQLGHRVCEPPVEYTRTRCMLSSLGLLKYEKNFEEGSLTDNTLPLLTDSVLKDVGVPPGPRLLILDHVKRDPEVKKMGEEHAG